MSEDGPKCVPENPGGVLKSEQRTWYEKAAAKLANFDEELLVTVGDATKDVGEDATLPYAAFTLEFRAKNNPDAVLWSMTIKRSEEYIEHQLLGIAQKLRKEHLG